MRVFSTPSEAYLSALSEVWYSPEYISAPRGLRIKEISNYAFKVMSPSEEPIQTMDLDRNETIISYTEKEKELYNSGSNSVEDFAKASKFWTRLSNPDGTVNSGYGHLIWAKASHGNPRYEFWGQDPTPREASISMRTPWQWCVESLRADKDTRQAILRFSLPEHAWKGVKDFTCTMHGNFLIREDKLHLTIVMRSNDLVKGTVYDVPFFCSLITKMVNELKDVYPELEVGTYTHIAHSLHIYEQDEDKVIKMLGQ